MEVFVEVFGVFGLTISRKQDGDHVHTDYACTGQQYRQTTSFTSSGGAVTKTPNLSDEIDRRIRAGWMSFRRYTRELYDRPKTSLLHLKAWMVKPEVGKVLLYGRAT